ncbi:hypothetical protein [Bacillus sp. S3]|uniref:hypothetical protein n=1 Tax=Bacillus sp. S3 TaxID=486398 RepID=UPI003988D45C
MIRILPPNGNPIVVVIKDNATLQDLTYSYQEGEQITVKRVNQHLFAVGQTPIIWTNGNLFYYFHLTFLLFLVM